MRVSSNGIYASLSSDLNDALNRAQTLQGQVASGRRINQLSDDPVGAAAALRLREEEAAWSSWQRAAGDANDRLGSADGTLQSMSSALQRVKELGVSAANGSLDPTARGAIADELSQLRDQLVQLANTQFLGQSLFGGFAATAVGKDATGAWTYVGDSGRIDRQVGPSVSVPANIDGKAAFGFDGSGPDLFSAVDGLAQAVRSGDPAALQQAQSDVDRRTTGVLSGLSLVGALVNRVNGAVDQGQGISLELTKQRSQLEDTDMASAVLQLQEAQLGYQAALGAVARANLPSLADYLK